MINYDWFLRVVIQGFGFFGFFMVLVKVYNIIKYSLVFKFQNEIIVQVRFNIKQVFFQKNYFVLLIKINFLVGFNVIWKLFNNKNKVIVFRLIRIDTKEISFGFLYLQGKLVFFNTEDGIDYVFYLCGKFQKFLVLDYVVIRCEVKKG